MLANSQPSSCWKTLSESPRYTSIRLTVSPGFSSGTTLYVNSGRLLSILNLNVAPWERSFVMSWAGTERCTVQQRAIARNKRAAFGELCASILGPPEFESGTSGSTSGLHVPPQLLSFWGTRGRDLGPRCGERNTI